jgi:hypothetical protein
MRRIAVEGVRADFGEADLYLAAVTSFRSSPF